MKRLQCPQTPASLPAETCSGVHKMIVRTRPLMQAYPAYIQAALRSQPQVARLQQHRKWTVVSNCLGEDSESAPTVDHEEQTNRKILSSERGSGFFSIRSRFIEALAALAAARLNDYDAIQQDSQEKWLFNRTSSTNVDLQLTPVEQDTVDDTKYAQLELSKPGFSFSAAGLLFPYHLGVGQCLIENKYITERTPLSGSSAGALVCAVIASGLSMEDAMHATRELASDCRKNGTAFRLGVVLRQSLDKCLPEDAHIRLSGKIRVAITQVFRAPRALLVEQFFSKVDLIDALIASCFVPGYLAPRPVTLYRNRICLDGGLTSFMPPTAAQTTVRVCAFSAEKLGLKNVGISPDCNPASGRASTRQLLNWALEPADDVILDNLFDLGYQDALVWVNQYQGGVMVPAINSGDLKG